MMTRSKCFENIYLYLILFHSFSLLFGDLSTRNYNLKRLQISDLPKEKDLLKYLKTIEAVTAYNTEKVNGIEINLAFGIFLSIVNLRRALKKKGHSLPRGIITRIRNNIVNNEEILNYYNKVTRDDDSSVPHTEDKQISTLFTNASMWVNRLKKFVNRNRKFHSLNELQEMYPPWYYYLKYVGNITKGTPNPVDSDMCLKSLAVSPVEKKYFYSLCPVVDSCYKILDGGNNFGYALTHRALLLLMAYFGRGCNIFSPEKDNAMVATYCSIGYAEAEYIAINNYGIVDLMMEIMCLCSLEGDTRFLRRSWLNNVLYFQKPQGCFGTQTRFKNTRFFDRHWLTSKSRHSNSSLEECHSHTTALALGIYSAAIRYIVQENY